MSSQSDTEKADLDRERRELATEDESERNELAAIYASRGVEPSLARQVADQLMAHDALAAHARDELGISDLTTARHVQAAFASAGTFAIGAAMPLVTALVTPRTALIPVVIATSIPFLALLGGFGAHAGGATVMKAAFRVTFGERSRWDSRRAWVRYSGRPTDAVFRNSIQRCLSLAIDRCERSTGCR